jgi:hypothetical protein
MVLIRTLFLESQSAAHHFPVPAGEVYRAEPRGDKRWCQETAASDARLFAAEHG